MRPTYGVLLLVFLLWFTTVSAQKENNSVLDQKVTLELHNKSIAFILDSISSQIHVFFSYDAVLVKADSLSDVSADGISLLATLDTLFNSNFEYQILGDQIIIAKHVATNPEPALIKPKTIIYRGKVLDRERKEVQPYTGISIFGTNIGTLSNIDGDFELKIPEKNRKDTVVFSHLGFQQYRKPIGEITEEFSSIQLQPTSIRLKEVQIIVLNANEIVNRVVEKIGTNYPHDPEIMTAFYREVLKQDAKYIDVAEAVMDIQKAPYGNINIPDRVKVLKGRKSNNVEAHEFVDFKIQGGPYYITQLDMVKTLESFLDPEFRDSHKYWLDDVVEMDERKTYVIQFKPIEKIDYPCYQGKLYVDMSTLALVQAEFSLTRSGLKFANQSLIKKKPKDLTVRTLNADYIVSYRRSNNKWHLSSAQAAISFKVKSKSDKVNSTFHSVSDLLITDFKTDDGTHFKRDEVFNAKDIFTETITAYDDGFWGDYNTIKPSEDLREALQNYYLKNDSLFRINKRESKTEIKK